MNKLVMARGALNEAAASLLAANQTELKSPDDANIMETLQAQTHALIGIGYLLEAILEEVKK